MKKRKRRRYNKLKILPPQGPEPWQQQAFAAGARSVRDELTLAGAQNFLQAMLNDHVNNYGSDNSPFAGLIVKTLNQVKELREECKKRNSYSGWGGRDEQ
jgi:hypothetical protein